MKEVPGGKDPGVRRSDQRAVQEEVQVMCFQEETRRGADMWVVTQDMKHQGKKGHLKEILRKSYWILCNRAHRPSHESL